MNTLNIGEFDNQGRISISQSLMQLCNIEKGEEVAICNLDKERIMFRKLDNIENSKVICTARFDEKYRIIIPKEIREETKKVARYVQEGNLILEEAQ